MLEVEVIVRTPGRGRGSYRRVVHKSVEKVQATQNGNLYIYHTFTRAASIYTKDDWESFELKDDRKEEDNG